MVAETAHLRKNGPFKTIDKDLKTMARRIGSHETKKFIFDVSRLVQRGREAHTLHSRRYRYRMTLYVTSIILNKRCVPNPSNRKVTIPFAVLKKQQKVVGLSFSFLHKTCVCMCTCVHANVCLYVPLYLYLGEFF